MLINELPDDCLHTIFNYLEKLEDLINCYKVCERWSNVIADRTKKYKYLIEGSDCSPDYAYSKSVALIDVPCLIRLFPNLRILQFSGEARKEYIVKLVKYAESLKGLILDYSWNLEFIPINANIEMLSFTCFVPCIREINGNVKQLYLLKSYVEKFKQYACYFPNIERLKIDYLTDSLISDLNRRIPIRNWPELPNIKIAELGISSDCCSDDLSWLFDFMDSFPSLVSAYILPNYNNFSVNESLQNINLQDLVIQFFAYANAFTKSVKQRVDIRGLMSKYPNLKHLALRDAILNDEDIKQLILILPKLTLLDVRTSHGVTQEAAYHVQDYCEMHGRSIKFYFKKGDKQIEADWPQLSTQPEVICRGFDFMKNCFLKPYIHLPHFLDPIDD